MTEIQNPYTVDMAVNATTVITLPCAQTLTMQRLRLKDRTACINQYAVLLQSLTVALDRDPTREEARTLLPDVLIDAYYAEIPVERGEDEIELVRIGQPRIMSLFQHYFPALTIEQVDAWEYDDFAAVWEALWQQCRIPFERGYTTWKGAMFQVWREEWKTMTSRPLSSDSSEPDLIPETETSNVSIAKPSTKRKRATSSAHTRK